MTTLRRFRALPRPAATSDAARNLVERMRRRADATILTVRSKPQTDRRRQARP
jgi:hypothetical protein